MKLHLLLESASMDSVKTAYCSYFRTPEGVNTYNKFKNILYSESDSLIRVLNTDIIKPIYSVPRMDRVRVCDIGGGDGKRVTSILRYLNRQNHFRFELDFVEQSEIYTQVFLNNPVGDFCETNIQTKMFEQASLDPQYYDLVLLIHSIFAFCNENPVNKILELRKPKGKIIVVANSPNSFLSGLKRIVDEKYTGRRYELDDLEATLNSKRVAFFKYIFLTKFVLSSDMNSKDVQTLLEWITLGRFSDFLNEKKKEIYQYIQESGQLTNNQIEVNENEVVLIISDRLPC